MTLTVTVITRNESAHIAAALESVAWANEIIVVDSESTDDTVAIAKRYTDHVVVRPWPGYLEQKNYAASLATGDWILSLDADERVTPELAGEIKALLATEPASQAYRMPRVAFHLGRWIRTTDWYPDFQLRLFDRRRGRWTGNYVHETVTVDGHVGSLAGELQHYPFRNISEHLVTIDRYTTLAAKQMYESGRRASVTDLLFQGPLAFLRNYVAKSGASDGAVGLVISVMNAYYVFLKFAKLWEMHAVPGSRFPVPGSGSGSGSGSTSS